jgi:menaquinone-9 beta-reductase
MMLDEVREQTWDALIVGAGPSGASLAAVLAGRGWTVMLIDRAVFPRDKTCGGCLNASAVAAFKEMDLHSVLRGAPKVDRFDLNVQGRAIDLHLAPGVTIPRDQLDSAIVSQAIERGACFISGASADLLPAHRDDLRHVRVRSKTKEAVIAARAVFACDGIRGTLLDNEPGCAWHVSRNSWFGVSTNAFDVNSQSGTIHMSVSQGGYVGRVRFADGRTHVAAALDVNESRRSGGPLQLMSRIFADCAQHVDLESMRPSATTRLTRNRPQLGAHRVLAIGDACGYVEPFTGEGIAWALRGVLALIPMLPNPKDAWPSDMVHRWTMRHRAMIGRRQMVCRAIRQLVRRPMLSKSILRAATLFPVIPEFVARRVGGMPTIAGCLTHGAA